MWYPYFKDCVGRVLSAKLASRLILEKTSAFKPEVTGKN